MRFRVESQNLEGAGDSPKIPLQFAGTLKDAFHYVNHYDRSRRIEDYFNFYEVIGEGGFSKVRRVVQKKTGDTYAVKIVDESKLRKEESPRVILEIETLVGLRHPSICQLHQVFYSDTKIYMVLEYCYSDLLEYLVRLVKPMSETKARRVFIQILSAINYLHNRGIVHRDIKPENILLKENLSVRLSDFGLAVRFSGKTNPLLSTYCGSLAYGAPEVISGVPYCGMKADIWSLGVNLYILLTNRHPFNAKKANLLRAQITTGRFPINNYNLGKRSLNLIKHLLEVNPLSRLRLEEIWKHPWIQEAKRSDSKNLDYTSQIRLGIENRNAIPSDTSQDQFWCHRPTCRSEPVELVKAYGRGSLRWLLFSTRKKLCQVKNLICCCSVST